MLHDLGCKFTVDVSKISALSIHLHLYKLLFLFNQNCILLVKILIWLIMMINTLSILLCEISLLCSYMYFFQFSHSLMYNFWYSNEKNRIITDKIIKKSQYIYFIFFSFYFIHFKFVLLIILKIKIFFSKFYTLCVILQSLKKFRVNIDYDSWICWLWKLENLFQGIIFLH